MTRLTLDQVTALAPDPQSVKAGQKLATPGSWPHLGENGADVIWGECKGSGRTPYQTRVDLTGPAYKCSCPSRKFPCKHVLGLLMIHAEHTQVFKTAAPPDWVSEWLDNRQKRTSKTKQNKSPLADPAMQAKREEKREKRVAQGLEKLNLWLEDLIRSGIGQLQNKPYGYWDAMAARLVDAQAPGVARQIRELANVYHDGDLWYELLLARLARIKLLISAYQRLETLEEPLRHEVRTQIGWTTAKESVLANPTLEDHWQAWGAATEVSNDGLRTQRLWLWGEKQRQWALILSFAHGTMPLDTPIFSGTRQQAQLNYYPGACQQRALIKEKTGTATPLCQNTVLHDFEDNLNAYAQALSCNPWIAYFPMLISNVYVRMENGEQHLYDHQGYLIPIKKSGSNPWLLITLSGGKPFNCFGEWNGRYLHLLAVLIHDNYVPV